MPIKGLTGVSKFPRAGKFHLGEKRLSEKTGREYPVAVDYFVYPEEYREVLTDIYGPKPRALSIMFPVDDINVVAPQWYKRYSSAGLICRGDGEVAVQRNDEGIMEEIECPGVNCPYYESRQCRHILNLLFLIPQLISEGVFQLDTSSYHSIVNINSSINYIRALTGGRLAMIPLTLRIAPKEVRPGGKRMITHVLELRPARQFGLEELHKYIDSHAAPPAAIPEPDTADEVEYFYPSRAELDHTRDIEDDGLSPENEGTVGEDEKAVPMDAEVDIDEEGGYVI